MAAIVVSLPIELPFLLLLAALVPEILSEILVLKLVGRDDGKCFPG